ncbi:MAG TPA: class I SAM-dependent methyltransferase [Longimicrobiales bacterium]
MSGSPGPWWRQHFDDDYFRLHDPLFSEEQSREEVGAMLELLGLPAGARILDVPCGWGRHTRLLSEAGFEVTGADLSPDLLRRARAAERATPGAASPLYVAADLRDLPFPDAAYDAVVNVYTSLGLFLDDDEDVRALREARRLLAPGGAFLLESMHRDEIMAAYVARDAWSLPDGTHVRVRRRFDPVAGITFDAFRWTRGSERGGKSHALRLRTATEIDALLAAAGFDDVEWFGDWDLSPLRRDSPRVIALCR